MNRVHQRVHCVRGTQRAQGLDGGRADRDFPMAAVVIHIALTVRRARGGNECRYCGWISQPFKRPADRHLRPLRRSGQRLHQTFRGFPNPPPAQGLRRDVLDSTVRIGQCLQQVGG